MNRILLICYMLWGGICLQAKEYTIQEIPMVHLENTCTMSAIPTASFPIPLDSILYALEEKTGIQTMVVAITDIEGGDCFDFAY